MQIDIEKLRLLAIDTYKKHSPADNFLFIKELKTENNNKFNRDVQTSATIIAENGTSPENRIFLDNITIPTFEVSSRNSIRYAQASRAPDVYEKTVIAATREVIKVQNSNIIEAIMFHNNQQVIINPDGSSTTESNSIYINDSFSRENMLELIANMNNEDLICETIVMSPDTFVEMMMWDNLFGFELVKPIDYCNMILVGKFMLANVFLSKDIGINILALPGAEKLGYIPFRDFDVVISDRDMEKIITVYLNSGIGVLNSNKVFNGIRRVG